MPCQMNKKKDYTVTIKSERMRGLTVRVTYFVDTFLLHFFFSSNCSLHERSGSLQTKMRNKVGIRSIDDPLRCSV